MKTKLLKKVRKRFSIVDHPNGRLDDLGEVWSTMYCVMDRDSIFKMFPYDTNTPYEISDNDTKEQAFEKAYAFLKDIIDYIYATKKHKTKKKTVKEAKYPVEKVWPPKIEPVEKGGGLVAW